MSFSEDRVEEGSQGRDCEATGTDGCGGVEGTPGEAGQGEDDDPENAGEPGQQGQEGEGGQGSFPDANATAIQPLAIDTSELPEGTVGVPYSTTIAASGGNLPYAFAIEGALPAGLESAGAAIVGTPTEAGSFPVEAEVADSSDPSLSVTAGFTLTVKPATGEGGQGGKGSEGRKGGESNEGKAGNGSQGGGGVSGSTAGAGGGTAGAASASSGGKEVSVPLSCEDPAGASCELSVQLSVTETIENGRVTAVSSRVRASGARFSSRKRNGRGKRAVHKTIVIGRVSATLTAGQHKTVTVKLNATGRKLLEQHHSLKIALTVTQAAGAGKPRTVDSSRLTLRGGKHRHRTERTARRSG